MCVGSFILSELIFKMSNNNVQNEEPKHEQIIYAPKPSYFRYYKIKDPDGTIHFEDKTLCDILYELSKDNTK